MKIASRFFTPLRLGALALAISGLTITSTPALAAPVKPLSPAEEAVFNDFRASALREMDAKRMDKAIEITLAWQKKAEATGEYSEAATAAFFRAKAHQDTGRMLEYLDDLRSGAKNARLAKFAPMEVNCLGRLAIKLQKQALWLSFQAVGKPGKANVQPIINESQTCVARILDLTTPEMVPKDRVAESLERIYEIAMDNQLPTLAWLFAATRWRLEHETEVGTIEDARAARDVGFAVLEMGKYAQAYDVLESARKVIAVRQPNSPELATVLTAMARAAGKNDSAKSARRLLDEARAILDKAGRGKLEEARWMDAMARHLLESQGDTAEAGRLADAAVALMEKNGASPEDLADGHFTRAAVLEAQGKLQQSAELLQKQVYELAKENPNSRTMARYFLQQGQLAWKSRLDAGAQTLFQYALNIQPPMVVVSPEAVAALRGLASIASSHSDRDVALERYATAHVFEAELTKEPMAEADRRAEMLDLDSELIRPDEVWGRLEPILKIWDQHDVRREQAIWLLISFAQATEDLTASTRLFKEAEQRYSRLDPPRQQSLRTAYDFARSHLTRLSGDLAGTEKILTAIAERYRPWNTGGLTTAKILDNLANIKMQLARASGDLAKYRETEALLRQAWELTRETAEDVTGDESRIAFKNGMRRVYLRLVECEAKLGQPMEALRVLEDGRAMAWRKRLQESDAAQTAATSPEASTDTAVQWFDAQRQRTLAAQAFLNAQANLAAARERKAGADEIATLEKAQSESEKLFGQAVVAAMQARRESEAVWEKAHTASAQLAPAKVDLDTLLAALPPGTVYAAYSIHNQGAVLALARRDTASTKPVVTSYLLTLPDGKKPAADLNVRCEEFTAAARNTRVPVATVQQQGRELGEILFPAEARAILAKAQHLIVSPDGPLWEVPLAALRLSQEGGERYLGEICPLSIVPSLAVLAQLQKRPAAGAKINALVVGNPTYDKPGAKSRGFAPLPETAQEGTSVAKIYAITPLLAGKPTEAAVRTAMAKADVIHLATHGTFDDQRAMASGIALAAGNGKEATPADDGLLQASEIYGQLRLHAQLVVLSSCEGGRGEVLTIGEGAVGLPWALQVAGARAVLASLWRVGGGTKELMTEFHQRLAKDEAQDAALQAAMRRVRETPGWEHPYYWSAFLLNGDARPLKAAAL